MASMMASVGARTAKFGIKTKNAESLEALQGEPAIEAHRVRHAGRFLSLGRRIRTGLHGHRAADSAGGHSAASGLRGQQRRDAVQRAPGGAGQAGDARSSSRCAARCASRNRSGRRWARRSATCSRWRAAPRLADFGIFVSGTHDGHADLRPGRRGDEDHRRADRAAARPLPDDAAHALAAGDEPHRQIGLRPVQLLHRVLPALPAGLRSAAAQGDAQPGLHARPGADIWNQWSELCCACGLCTLYACPEDLYPKEACDDGKRDRRARPA